MRKKLEIDKTYTFVFTDYCYEINKGASGIHFAWELKRNNIYSITAKILNIYDFTGVIKIQNSFAHDLLKDYGKSLYLSNGEYILTESLEYYLDEIKKELM